MLARAKYPESPIGNAAAAGLLVAYFLVSLFGTNILGGRLAPTTLIWPASGVGLALVLLRGIGVWPLIFAAGVMRSAVSLYASPVPVMVGSALVNGFAAVLEPVLAAWLIWRVAGESYLERAGPFLLAMLVAAPVAVLAATVPMIVGQFTVGLVSTYAALGPFETWHAAAISHLMALLTLTPPIWLWTRHARPRLEIRRALELLAWLGLAAFALAIPEPAQPRYLLAAAHLAIALRLPLAWSATAVSLSSLVYLWQGMLGNV